MGDIFQMRALVAKALAHPTRLRIIDFLMERPEACVCEIIEYLREGQSTISKHLSVLKDVGLVDSRKSGLMVMYSLRAHCIQNFFACLDTVLLDDLERKQQVVSRGGEQ